MNIMQTQVLSRAPRRSKVLESFLELPLGTNDAWKWCCTRFLVAAVGTLGLPSPTRAHRELAARVMEACELLSAGLDGMVVRVR